MAKTAAPPLSEPAGQVGGLDPLATVHERGQRRRRQLLEAAEACFGRHGFHAASMAGVAAEAGMSVGQVYRDFENKDAMIAAVVERELQRVAGGFARIGEAPEGVNGLQTYIEDLTANDAPALFLEVMAEAARNPKIAARVAREQSATRQSFTDLFVSGRGAELGRDRVADLTDLLQLLLAGLRVRAASEANLDGRRMLRLLYDVIAAAAHNTVDEKRL